MNKLALAMCIMVTIFSPSFCAALDHVVISEVLYDPAGTETGGEAVEIYNPTGQQVDISGYLLKTESSAADATIPAGTILKANSFYLIADAGWSTLKDNTSWPNADHEEAITMSNTDSGVAITYPNGTIIDAVGWGSAAGIGAGLYEGNPAAQVVAGKSLMRTDLNSDTDDNSANLAESVPELKNSSETGQQQELNSSGEGDSIAVSVSVTNNAPDVSSAAIENDEDNTTAGIQVTPIPEGTKNMAITTNISDTDGINSIVQVIAIINGPDSDRTVTLTKTEDISNTTARYDGTIEMQFYDRPGAYNMTIIADDGSTNATRSIEFEYLGMTAISIDTSSLYFTGARVGATTEITGDYALSTADKPTIRNIGNTQIDLGIYGTDLIDGVKNIGISNMKYSFDNDFTSDLAGTLSKTLQTKSIGLENSEDSIVTLGFQLFIPPATQNGNYTGNITIVAVSS